MESAGSSRHGRRRHRRLVSARGLDLTALDRWTIAYLAFATAVLAVRPPEGWPLLLAGYLTLAAVALAAPSLRSRGGVQGFLGEFYPLIATLGLYTAVGMVNGGAGIAHDPIVQGWEQALFGGQPSLEWIRAQPSPALSRVLHVGYLSYYVILAGAPLGLWVMGRRAAARRVVLLMTATFYLCYAAFMLFPVAGPRYLFPLPDNAATATMPARLAHRLLERGSAWGTAFPSSHVAVALVAAVVAARRSRALGVVLVPAAVLLALGTVYGQFHYAVDALAGAVMAAAVLAWDARGPEHAD